jgi:hypothetical protein
MDWCVELAYFQDFNMLHSRGVMDFSVIVLFGQVILMCINDLCGRIMKAYYDDWYRYDSSNILV